MWKPSTDPRERILLFVVALGLVALPLASWFPSGCPVLRKALIGCYSTTPAAPPTAAQKEVMRIPHQSISNDGAQFSVSSTANRSKTTVYFQYHADLAKETDYLQVKTAFGMADIGLITSPLLTDLGWGKSTEKGFTAYSRSTQPTGISELLASHPGQKMAADRVAAATYKLSLYQYAPLASLSSLDGIDYVLTSYSPGPADGSWRSHSGNYDLSQAQPGEDGKLAWTIRREGKPTTPLLLGNVQVDYHQSSPN